MTNTVKRSTEFSGMDAMGRLVLCEELAAFKLSDFTQSIELDGVTYEVSVVAEGFGVKNRMELEAYVAELEEQARKELDAVANRLSETVQENVRLRLQVDTLREEVKMLRQRRPHSEYPSSEDKP